MKDENVLSGKNKLPGKSRLSNISSVLPGVVVKLGLDRRMQEQALFSLWPSFVDPIYARRSKPLYLDGQGNVVVAVDNGSTAQELSFVKAKVLKDLQKIGHGLGLSVKGIRFDLKRFHETQQQIDSIPAYDAVIDRNEDDANPSDIQLSELALTSTELEEIEMLKKQLNEIPPFSSDEENNKTSNQSTRIVALVEKKIRLKKWYQQRNLPVCQGCGELLARAYRDLSISLCSYCNGQNRVREDIASEP